MHGSGCVHPTASKPLRGQPAPSIRNRLIPWPLGLRIKGATPRHNLLSSVGPSSCSPPALGELRLHPQRSHPLGSLPARCESPHMALTPPGALLAAPKCPPRPEQWHTWMHDMPAQHPSRSLPAQQQTLLCTRLEGQLPGAPLTPFS